MENTKPATHTERPDLIIPLVEHAPLQFGPPIIERDLRLSAEAPAAPSALIPSYRITSALIQVALEQGSVTKKGVIDFLVKRRVSRQEAIDGLKAHVYMDNFAYVAAQAQDYAKTIVAPEPTKRRPKFNRESVTLPPQRTVTPEERQSISERRVTDIIHQHPGTVALAQLVPSDLLTNLQRGFIEMLDPINLSTALVPLEDSAYWDVPFQPRLNGRHQHAIKILADDTVRVCGIGELALSREEILITNVLLTFGKYGLISAALDKAGIVKPRQAMNSLRHKLNTGGHGVITKERYGSAPINVLGPVPSMVWIKDLRLPAQI